MHQIGVGTPRELFNTNLYTWYQPKNNGAIQSTRLFIFYIKVYSMIATNTECGHYYLKKKCGVCSCKYTCRLFIPNTIDENCDFMSSFNIELFLIQKSEIIWKRSSICIWNKSVNYQRWRMKTDLDSIRVMWDAIKLSSKAKRCQFDCESCETPYRIYHIWTIKILPGHWTLDILTIIESEKKKFLSNRIDQNAYGKWNQFKSHTKKYENYQTNYNFFFI